MNKIVLLLATFALCALVGCGSSEPAPEPTATTVPTAAPEPTATQVPTAAPEPTATTVPTATPQPTATQVPTAVPEPTATTVPTAVPEPTATQVPTAVPEPTATTVPTAVPEPTAVPPQVDPAPIVESWLSENIDVISDHLVAAILAADLGYAALDVHIKTAIKSDVVEQVGVGVEVEFDLSLLPNRWDEIPVTVTSEVEIMTEPQSLAGGLVKIPALTGTITVSKPYVIIWEEQGFTWAEDPEGASVEVKVETP